MGVIKVECVILNARPQYIEVDITAKDTARAVSFIAFFAKNPVFSRVCGLY